MKDLMLVSNLALLTRRMSRKLKQLNPEDELANQADRYLEEQGLIGTPLKETTQATDTTPSNHSEKP